MEDFDTVGRIGEGAHGIVFKAKHLPTGRIVALKKVSLKRLDEGIPNRVLREIKALQELEHINIMKLLEVFPQSNGFVLVSEFMTSDLGELIRDWELKMSPALKKSYLKQLLNGVAYMHENSIMHRDLKPANLLVSQQGVLKIADFGQARLFFKDEDRLYSHQVATRWYRAPELLYGSRNYDERVDMWAVGCIFGEMINHSPLFPGENDIEQLVYVFRLLGTPNEENWPGVAQLPDYSKISFPDYKTVPMEQIVPEAESDAVALLSNLLLLDFNRRISAQQALEHEYFSNDPKPIPTELLPPPKPKCSQPSGVTFDPSQPISTWFQLPIRI